MFFLIWLLSFFSKKAAARLVFGGVENIEDGRLVYCGTSRGSQELRGTYRGRSVCIRVCMTWGSAWLTMRTRERLEGRMDLSHDSEMGRRKYEAKVANRDPEWDEDSVGGPRRYLSKRAYLEGECLAFRDADETPEQEYFDTLPEPLRNAVVAVVDQDSHGTFRLSGSDLKVSVQKRIFWSLNAANKFQVRLDLAADVLDAIELGG